MIRVSCSTKFHAFALAEQLQRHQLLDRFYTTYFSQKNWYYRKLHHRVDHEKIPAGQVKTFPFFLPRFWFWKDKHLRAVAYDEKVAAQLRRRKADYKAFIGWSSMSLTSARQAKADGKLVLIERGSSHIQVQNEILSEEYASFGRQFSIDNRIIERELEEYELADYVVVPSQFVRNSFLQKGFPEEKLFLNNYGSNGFFKTEKSNESGKFRVLYLGGLVIRKGLKYLFDAVNALDLPKDQFEFWIIGSVADELKELVEEKRQNNWKFFGHINHYELADYIAQCDVAVQPSLEEGLSMVIPQMLTCGLPVIASTNSGGMDLIQDGENGFIVPIRDSESIKQKIEYLFEHRQELSEMKKTAAGLSAASMTWDAYGDRYAQFLRSVI